MTAQDVQLVEESLGLTLPAFYASFMLEYPAELSETVIRLGDSPESPSGWEILGAAHRVVAINRSVREPGVEWTADGGPWPGDQLAIGEDVGGDYFSVDLTGASRAVFRFDHETGAFEEFAPSLEVFAQVVVLQYMEYNRRRL